MCPNLQALESVKSFPTFSDDFKSSAHNIDLASKSGYRNKSSIVKIETDTNDIVQSKVVEFANILDTTAACLMGWESIPKNGKRKDVTI